MSRDAILRDSEVLSELTLDATLADTPEISYKTRAGGMIFQEATEAGTLLTFYAAYAAGGTYFPITDKNNVAVTLTTTASVAQCHPIPDECFGAPYLKIVTDNDGDKVTISLKT